MLNSSFKKISEYIPLMKLTASSELELDIKNKLSILDKLLSIESRSLRKLAEALIATAKFDNKFCRKGRLLGSVKSLLIVRLEDEGLELELE